ncbi:MAG: phage holin family protein [Streptosporangiaceae bacterium]|jgi:MFS family permease
MADVNGAPNSARTPAAPTGDLVKQMTEQVSRLIRDELKLAEIEMTRKGARAGRGIGIFGGSGVIALYAVGCLLAAAIAGIATAVPVWLAALIVGVVLLGVAGIGALAGRSQLKKATPAMPEETVQSVKADVEEIKERAHR